MALTLNGDDGIAGVDGSATTPAIQGTDSNTGISFGTDTVNVVTGGSNRTTVDSSGRLLVGTSTARALYGVTAKSQIEGTDNTSSLSCVRNTNDGGGAYILLGKSRGTAVGGSTIVQSGDVVGAVYFTGADGTDVDTPLAGIEAEVDGTPGSNDMPGRLTFSTTADGASSPTERMRITSNGTVLIGKTSESYSTAGIELPPADWITVTNDNLCLRLNRTGADGEVAQFMNDGTIVGRISVSGSTTSYNTSSDYRLKENVVPLSGAADRLNQLQVRRFNFIADPDTTVDGFIAHEAQAVVPEAVTGTQDEVDDDGNPVYQGIDQSKLVPLLTAALQEALAKIETLETRLTALEGGAS